MVWLEVELQIESNPTLTTLHDISVCAFSKISNFSIHKYILHSRNGIFIYLFILVIFLSGIFKFIVKINHCPIWFRYITLNIYPPFYFKISISSISSFKVIYILHPPQFFIFYFLFCKITFPFKIFIFKNCSFIMLKWTIPNKKY